MDSEANKDTHGMVSGPLLTAAAPLLSEGVQESKPMTNTDSIIDFNTKLQKTSEDVSASHQGQVLEGSECAIQTLYEGPPKCQCCKNWVEEYPNELRMAIEEQQQTKQKALVVRMRKNHDEGKLLVLDSIVIQSSSLKSTLGEVFEGYQGITASLKKLVFRSPFHPFYYRWAALEQILQRQKLAEPEAAGYTQLLRDVLYSELRDVMTEIDDLISHRVITYPLLWALFEPGIRILSLNDGRPGRYFIVEDCVYNRMEHYLGINARFVDWDGHRFGYGKTTIPIFEYGGTRAVDQLNVLPASFHLPRQKAEADAIARGRRFVELRGCHYVTYSGAFRCHKIGGKSVVRQVDGRTVVDAASYFDNKSDRRISLAALDPKLIRPQMEIEERGHISPKAHPNRVVADTMLKGQRPGAIRHPNILDNGDLPKGEKAEPDFNLTDEQLLLCNPRVRGYSLTLKQWGEFEVDNIGEIVWNDGAFPNLMLPSGYKDLILSFVEGKATSKGTFDDIIEGKGLGLIMLLAGNPGTGKTLTAEAVADKVRRPLYALSAGELGQEARNVEHRLSSILRLAEAWDAVLLFDECDVFLQERSMKHLGHNEIVAVFLRLLEYYRGILIMTTNRGDSIDRAFRSRVHLTLFYPDLEADAKEHIWRQFIARSAQEDALTDETYARLAQLPMNGRQIKNVVQIATLLAAQQKSNLGFEQIRTVLTATKEAGEIDI
ncbi:hypothetical protein VMCG_08305 [Cytospora schulzeri]|uniref:AAA+ ATPase domain-containing protein n=1 Tax=Cytospora schulzeri TaxID=448051 RepID=A0A423VVF7_9PEZI|nr:hypothetical protein VMCG_08305 [Valsa malicola]